MLTHLFLLTLLLRLGYPPAGCDRLYGEPLYSKADIRTYYAAYNNNEYFIIALFKKERCIQILFYRKDGGDIEWSDQDDILVWQQLYGYLMYPIWGSYHMYWLDNKTYSVRMSEKEQARRDISRGLRVAKKYNENTYKK